MGGNICKNCNQELLGVYCANCGQHERENKRIVFKDFRIDFFSRIFDLNKGFLFTIGNLLIRPGEVGHNYIEGKRARYTNPLRFLVIAIAIQTFINFWFVHPELAETLGFIYFNFFPESVNMGMGKWHHVLGTDVALGHSVFMILVFPVIYFLLFRKSNFNYTELITIHFYYFANALIMINILSLIFSLVLSSYVPEQYVVGLFVVNILWTSFDFFKSVNFFERILKIVFAIVLFVIFRLFLITYILNLIFPLD